MERHGENIRYSSFSFIQDIMSFLIKYLLSFHDLIEIIFHSLLHLKQDHGFNFVYPYLQTKNISPSCTFNSNQYPSFKLYNIKDKVQTS